MHCIEQPTQVRAEGDATLILSGKKGDVTLRADTGATRDAWVSALQSTTAAALSNSTGASPKGPRKEGTVATVECFFASCRFCIVVDFWVLIAGEESIEERSRGAD